MGQLKVSASHLSLVPPIPTFEPYYLEAETPWWKCPGWCLGDCYGGGAWITRPEYVDRGVDDFRMHERITYSTQAVDDVDRGAARVEVRIERCDAEEDPEPPVADVVVRFTVESDPNNWFGVRLSRAQRRELAAALLNADDLDETPVAPVAVAVG